MSNSLPLVSIGMPIYNEGKHLPQALDSLLAQDFENLEIVICDNASFDATQQICFDYVRRDARIRYHCNETNLGAVTNFNNVFSLSSGDYFMWASGHDIWAPTFVARCVQILEEDPSVVLSYPRAIWIDPDGNDLGLVPHILETRGLTLVPRFNVVIWSLTESYYIYGLIRSSMLKQTRLFRNVPGADHVLLMELSLLGSFAQIQEPIFYFRKNRPGENRDQIIEGSLNRLFGASRENTNVIPHFKMCYEYFRATKRGSMSFSRKLILVASTILCSIAKYHSYLLFDLRSAAKSLRHRLRGQARKSDE